jgi:hypothetical protein
MDTIGLDLHKRESQVCILGAEGTVRELRIATTRERMSAVCGQRPRARVLVEASTESEWVAQHLEELGHEVDCGGPELRAYVRDPAAAREDRSARCADAGGGVAIGRLSRGAPCVGGAAPRRSISEANSGKGELLGTGTARLGSPND